MAQDQIFKRILVGDNGTPEADHAIEVALSLGESVGAVVILLGVVAPASAESEAEGIGLQNPAHVKRQLEERLAQTVEIGRGRGIGVITELVEGDPATEIERRSEMEDVDLIVIGRRDVSRVRHWLEGSTSETLVRKSSASVLVVHEQGPH